jgi:MFS family permease
LGGGSYPHIGSHVFGLIVLGYLSDNFDLRLSILLSALGSSLTVFFLWGFSNSLAPLVIFAAVYGFLAPSWSALWPRFISSVVGDDVQTSETLMSIFLASRGIGNVLSAPISVGLLHPWSLTDHSHFAYGLKGYVGWPCFYLDSELTCGQGPLILFTGSTFFVSTLGAGYKSFNRGEGCESRRRR